jgi:uncharacterized membrane protein
VTTAHISTINLHFSLNQCLGPHRIRPKLRISRPYLICIIDSRSSSISLYSLIWSLLHCNKKIRVRIINHLFGYLVCIFLHNNLFLILVLCSVYNSSTVDSVILILVVTLICAPCLSPWIKLEAFTLFSEEADFS